MNAEWRPDGGIIDGEVAVRWANVPIPEPYVAAIIGATVMRVVAPIRVPLSDSTARLIGWPMLAGGISLATWAVASAGDADIERGSELVTTGAYARSRNPMYVGWAAAIVGIATMRRDPWLVTGWLFATRAVAAEVLREEVRLSQRFGTAYGTYRRSVPRYLRLLRR